MRLFRSISWLAAVAIAAAAAPATAQSLLWQRTVPGALAAFATGADGSMALVGGTSHASATDFSAMKIAGASGGIVWQKSFSHPATELDDAVSVAVDGQGNVVMAHSVSNAGNSDISVSKYRASDGALAWQRTFDGGGNDFARKVRCDGAGNAIVAAESHGAAGDSNVRILKLSAADGAIIWDRTVDSGRADTVSDLALDAAGNAHAAGASANAAGHDDFAVFKLAAADGALLWRNTFDGGATDQAYSVAVDGTGNVVVTGYSMGATVDFRTVKFAGTSGTISWSKAFDAGNEDLAQSVALDSGGNAVVVGHSRNRAGNLDIKTIKYAAADGTTLWERTVDGGADDFAFHVAVDFGGNAVVAGSRGGASGSEWSVVQYAGDGGELWQHRYAAGDAGAFAVGLGPGALFVAGTAQEAGAPAIRVARLGAPALAPAVQSAADWNADGRPDLLMRHAVNGNLFAWHMRDRLVASDALLAGVDPSWDLEGVGDFNSDGKPDLVWRNSTSGATWVWYMNGATMTSDALLFTLPSEWKVEGVADFNRDTKPDFLMRNANTGVAFAWFFNNNVAIGDQFLFGIDPSWKVEQVGDINADGQPDLLFRSTTSGLAFAWYTQYGGGGTLSLADSSPSIFSIDPAWEIVQLGDWNGDDRPDLVFRNRDSGVVFIWYMSGTTLGASEFLFQVDPTWEIVPRR